MSPRKSRYITLCQQLLTLLAVGAVVAPAANILDLDVAPSPDAAASLYAPAVPAAAGEGDTAPVETGAVSADVEETQLTDTAGVADSENTTDEVVPEGGAETDTGTDGDVGTQSAPEESAPELDPTTELVSEPQTVTGFGAVGVTWSPDTPVSGDEITLSVRTNSGGEWSSWEEIPYEYTEEETDETAEAEAGTEEADARPGTELIWVGEVDEAQVQVSAPGGLPADVKVAVIDPGESRTTEEAPEYTAETEEAEPTSVSSSSGDLALASGTAVPRPAIYSRAQWGADERLRTSAPRYTAVKGAVIHHTVNANDYTQAQVPAIIRGIYSYHVKSQGWSDIGYNFLVDKFGRLWEGRYGGITNAVRGAHIAAYNDYAFGISAIGNYETAQPSAAMVEAISQLTAWKLAYHGISVNSTQTWGSVRMPAVIGHRDGGQTACPGRYLYAQLGNIRKRATAIQTTRAPTPGVGITFAGATTSRYGNTVQITYNFTNLTSGAPWVGLVGLGPSQYQNVRNNKVTFTVPANLIPKTYRFYLKLNNDGPGNGQTLTRDFTVTTGATRTHVNVARVPTPSAGGIVKTAVEYQGNATAGLARPSGNVTIQILRANGTIYWKAPQRWMNAGWLDNQAIPALPRGTFTVQTIYHGASTADWSYASQQITVR